MTRTHPATRTARRAAAAAAAVLTIGGLAACGSESAGPEIGAVTAGDLQELEDQVAGLDERVGTLEEDMGSAGALDDETAVAGADAGLFDDPPSYVGQEVTVSAEVSELYTTTDVGSAMRIAGESGEPVAVVSATPIAEIDANDVVQVTGMVMEVQQDTFEQDFGVAGDELFEDVDGFYADAEGEVAISADQIQVTQEASGN